jgi:chromosome segregation ATPase
MTYEEIKAKSKEYKDRMEKLDEIINFLTDEYDEAQANYDKLEYEIYLIDFMENY